MGLIDVVAGTRPNLIKAAAILRAFERRKVKNIRFVYTSQHYDGDLFEGVLTRLELRSPDVIFAKPTSADRVFPDVFNAYSELLRSGTEPSLTLVFGDVTSTLACALAARYAQVPVAHVEAGLRSHNWRMPEEVNRVAVDAIANIAFVTSEEARQNLHSHDNFNEQIYVVGNTMIDTLVASGLEARQQLGAKVIGESKPLLVCTFHRPENVDDSVRLRRIVNLICELSDQFQIMFPVHPRTANRIKALNLSLPQGVAVAPLPYLDFISRIAESQAVLTDSGGVSEETTFLGIPCLTLRNETERPETVSIGTNTLVGEDLGRVPEMLDRILSGGWKPGAIPPFWDGLAGDRIVEILRQSGFTE